MVKLNWQPERKKRKSNPHREGGTSDTLAAHPSKTTKEGTHILGPSAKTEMKHGAPGQNDEAEVLLSIHVHHRLISRNRAVVAYGDVVVSALLIEPDSIAILKSRAGYYLVPEAR